MFNFKTVHGSTGNNSFHKRRAFSMRFIGDDVTDEYGFKSVNNLGGYSIKVGYQSNTLANFFIKDTTSVLKFLNFVSFCSKKIRCQSLKLNHLYRGLN